MSDQISTLPLVIWQPSRRERLAKQIIIIKSRKLGMTEYQRRMLAAMQSGHLPPSPNLIYVRQKPMRFISADYAEVAKGLPRHPAIY